MSATRTAPILIRQLNEPSEDALKLAARELRKIGREILDAKEVALAPAPRVPEGRG